MTKRLIDYAEKHASVCFENDAISPILYKEYGVNTGLRDEKGTGVLTGLTRVSDIVSSKIIDGRISETMRLVLTRSLICCLWESFRRSSRF